LARPEELAAQSGPESRPLHVTFGHAPELIIALFRSASAPGGVAGPGDRGSIISHIRLVSDRDVLRRLRAGEEDVSHRNIWHSQAAKLLLAPWPW